LGAHPDDVELGAGGSICKFLQSGDSIYVLILSKGEHGVFDENLKKEERELSEGAKLKIKGERREKETREALKFLGIRDENIESLSFPDMKIDNSKELVQVIYNTILRINPDLIYIHFPEDDHPDHVNASLSTLTAGRRAKSIIFYESPSTRASFQPSCFVDISNCLEKKIEALRRHKTQQGKEYMEEEAIKTRARFRGLQAKMEGFAEAFVIYRLVE